MNIGINLKNSLLLEQQRQKLFFWDGSITIIVYFIKDLLDFLSGLLGSIQKGFNFLNRYVSTMIRI